jgi:hypothetical protein
MEREIKQYLLVYGTLKSGTKGTTGRTLSAAKHWSPLLIRSF